MKGVTFAAPQAKKCLEPPNRKKREFHFPPELFSFSWYQTRRMFNRGRARFAKAAFASFTRASYKSASSSTFSGATKGEGLFSSSAKPTSFGFKTSTPSSFTYRNLARNDKRGRTDQAQSELIVDLLGRFGFLQKLIHFRAFL